MLFETHQMMAEDLDYEEAIEDRITNQKMNAEAAVSDTAEQFAEMFASMDDAYMQARAADVKDVSQRILSILCGVVQGGIASDVPVLLAADDLAPSETIQLDKSKILGFITAGGSGSSHTAILARTMGIPAIVGVGDALKPEYEGRQAIADGSTGALVIDPDDDTRDRLLKKREEQQRLQRLLETLKGLTIHIKGPRPIAEAIVTSGGIKVGEIDPRTMQSKKLPGLFFAGELIDVDADTGGFNLQIAWATGRAAGAGAAAFLAGL